jgi:hypothetical protein
MSPANSLILLLMVLAVVGLSAWLLASRRGVTDRQGTRVVVRCLGGHVFTTTWPVASRWNPSRAAPVRWRWCPAGEHWTLATPVRPEDLSPAEWRMARHFHDDSVRCGEIGSARSR